MPTETTIEDLLSFENDARLKQLEEALSKFNVFEAIGATHKELWHSDFLAFLLNPKQNHGLGNEFTKRLMRYVTPPMPEVDSWGDVSVRREYKHIDILVQDEARRVSVIIENKIWSPEGERQLSSYWDAIASEHTDSVWHIRGIYLTPGGQPPSNERDRKNYHALSYGEVKDVLSNVLETKRGHLRGDVKLVIEHYVDMLRRFIVGNADPNAFARKIYFEHRLAIQRMNPALWKGLIKGQLEELIKQSPQLKLEDSNLEQVRFTAKEWADAAGLNAGTNIGTSYPMLYFTFSNFEDSLTLNLWVGPTVSAGMRANLLQLAEQNTPPFCKPSKDAQYYYVYHLPLLKKDDYEKCSDEEMKRVIEDKWHDFTERDLPIILRTLESADWFWNVRGEPIPSRAPGE